MTGPQGDTPHGYWRMFTNRTEPRSLEFANGLAGNDGRADDRPRAHGSRYVTFEPPRRGHADNPS